MKSQNIVKLSVAFLLSMIWVNIPIYAQTSTSQAMLALEKYQKALTYIGSENQHERSQAFNLLAQAADEGVMEACALMGLLYEEEGLFSDAAMFYVEALNMKIVASEKNDKVSAVFNDSRRGFLRSTLIDVTSKSPIEKKDIDMGLSVKWSSCNYNASNIEGAGSVMNHADAIKINEEGYRLPTLAEWEELMQNCIWIPAVVRGVSGFMVYGKGESTLVYGKQPDNVMFLPGGYTNLLYTEGGKDGYYWTSDSLDETKGRFFTFYNDKTLDTGSASKDLQFSVRLVKSN